MNSNAELEDFPLGCVVRTPTGCVGVVVKHRVTSKIDHFCRIDVQFSDNPRDGVVLQPKYLELIEMPPEDYRPPFQFQTATARARVVEAVKDAKRKSNDCGSTVATERAKSKQHQPLAGEGKAQEIVPVGVLGINEERQDQSRLAGNDPRLADVRSA